MVDSGINVWPVENSWQSVALELLRRRAGAVPAMSNHTLGALAMQHETKLQDKQIDGLYYDICNIEHPRRRLYQILWDAQAAAARSVVNALQNEGAQPILFKGMEIGARYDHGRGVGLREDVDLLLSIDAMWEAKRVLYVHGYRHGVYRPQTRSWTLIEHVKAARHEAVAYELVPFTAAVEVDGRDEAVLNEARKFKNLFCVHDDIAYVFVKFDIHHNILMDFDVAPLIERVVPSALGVGWALSPTDHLWFAIHRYYYEVSIGCVRSLRALALIAPMVGDPAIDWDQLIGNAVAQRATAPCLFWLTFFRHLNADAIPLEVLSKLRRHHHNSERNWGWQVERLFEITESFPALFAEQRP